ncbi:MAG: MBOAT family O-acyltransferase [Clostridia bacterium]|nr:MBOAT family O-acyltransferase [Clostridia bacterium]
MLFSSLLFLFRFLPLVLIAYYIVPKSYRNLILLVFSLAFYAWGEPIYIFLMLASILVSYTGGSLIDHFKQKGKIKKAKVTLMISAIISISFLAFFKYADFVIGIVNSITDLGIDMLKLELPIGISFYTFQTLSYMIDVYRGEATVQKNPISFGAYVTMFPQLIAGPIVQYKTIDNQLRERKETVEQFEEGINRFMIGLGKKVLIANNIGILWSTIQSMNYAEIPILTAWIGIIAYSFQIYFDFSAYSDMAIGLGHMFGFRFLENFNYPYMSKSITEFWRRWHISLSTWFREYIYIPLGGNRVKKWRHIFNIMVVWLLTGFWHGASLNFVLWGVYYGILLLLEKFIFGKYIEKLPNIFRHIYCMFFVVLGWNLFAFDNLGIGLEFMKSLFHMTGKGILNGETIYLLCNNMILIILCIIGSTRLPQRIGKWIYTKLENKRIIQTLIKNIFYIDIFILSVAWLVDVSFNPFLYFRF